jgi:hypothetical protein
MGDGTRRSCVYAQDQWMGDRILDHYVIPISFITGWINLVTYVSMLSLWALVSGHLSAWQAARVEVRQEEEKKKNKGEHIKQ